MSQELESSHSVVPFIGLKNRGNTCYLNSILQVLYFCPSFDSQLSKLSSVLATDLESDGSSVKEENKNSFLLIKALKEVFSHLMRNQLRLIEDGDKLNEEEIKDLTAVCPQDFIGCLRNVYPAFEPYTQQDAQECFHCILNICSSVISLVSSENFQKTDVSFYHGGEAKVVGGRRSHSVAVLTSNQNRESNAVRHSTGDRYSKSSDSKNCNFSEKQALEKENVCAFDHANNSREERTERSSTAGCFKGLKRRRLKLGGKDHASYGRLHKELSRSSQEKENQSANTFSSCSESGSEPAQKKRRLGSNLRIAPLKQPGLFKNLWKTKTERIFSECSDESRTKASLAPSTTAPTIDPTVGQAVSDHVGLAEPSAPEAVISKPSLPCDFVKEMFQGQLVTTIRCVECETEVSRYESFQDVSLPVKNIPMSDITDEAMDVTDENSSIRKVETCSLTWALNRYTSTESLCGDNKYFCDVCMRLSEGERTMKFHQLPPILTLHLKRFSTASVDSADFTSTVSKITSALEIPSTVEFSEWCSSGCVEKDQEYDLFAIVIHSGLTITGGHYLSYVKYEKLMSSENESLSSYDGQWLEMDDEKARLLSKEEMRKALNQGDFDLPTKSAYMLFYHRRT